MDTTSWSCFSFLALVDSDESDEDFRLLGLRPVGLSTACCGGFACGGAGVWDDGWGGLLCFCFLVF